ncbi:MAG: DUF2997 domain-containing protein [Planctomycetes bacterium]|nr:DUF2997 domain-containing protein [Planctomycetota bacterium]MCH9724422.1 DUF2997 domain-containing protein [Planctomycetota bacterium]MCH9776290.1 DUF2997 domain-containing protein [Planctomycetota bacterium]MCH9789491.1 DUF2997 domain-containing protein [Planctomycetota bacterium]
MKTIDIIFSSGGQSRIETRGFTGSQCKDASRFLETALGKVSSEQLTAEYHQGVQHQPNQLRQEN